MSSLFNPTRVGFRLTLATLLLAGVLIGCQAERLPVDVVIETEIGNVELHLYPDAPLHRENFLKLARTGYFDGTAFHRILNGSLVQGGDTISRRMFAPDSLRNADTLLTQRLGFGGPGYTLPAEISMRRLHKRGALSAARFPDQYNPERRSSGSQFFIVSGKKLKGEEIEMLEGQLWQQQAMQYQNVFLSRPENAWIIPAIQDQVGRQKLQVENPDSARRLNERLSREETKMIHEMEQTLPRARLSLNQRKAYLKEGGLPYLDGQYSVFGEVVSGMNVIDSLAAMPTNPGTGAPLKPIKLRVRAITAQ